MKAIKDNKSYTVNTDEEAKIYVSRGYDLSLIHISEPTRP